MVHGVLSHKIIEIREMENFENRINRIIGNVSEIFTIDLK